jgi:lipopolysaccharide/colanic/teichoic acid biosynthesis glycosyltransferase
MLASLSPLLIALFFAVRMTSRGPAVYRQLRSGRGGQPFTIYKFRSMVVDAEKGTGAVWATKNDPRVTPLGMWLRRLHLDELPQLLNIARGEMRFVGPRPERPEIVAELCGTISGYEQRLAVTPGLTGLAQVNLPPDETVDCVKRKFELDLEYISTASASLDLRLVFATALKMTGLPQPVVAAIAMVSRSPKPVVRRLAVRTPHHPWEATSALVGSG